MHAKPDLRVFLNWMIAGSGSVITDVMSLGEFDARSAIQEWIQHALPPDEVHRLHSQKL